MTIDELKAKVALLDAEIKRLTVIGSAGLSEKGYKGGNEAETKIRRAANDERWRKINEQLVLLWELQAPIMADFERHGIIFEKNGVKVSNLGLMIPISKSYDHALPLLLDHFQRDYHPYIKHMLIRLVEDLSARPYWSLLRAEFEKLGSGKALYDDSLGRTFVKTASIEDVDEVIDMLDNLRAPARIHLIEILRKYRKKSPKAEAAIQRMATHPDWGKWISSWSKPKPRKAPKPSLN